MLLLAIKFDLLQKGKPCQKESQANIRERKKREYKKEKERRTESEQFEQKFEEKTKF